MTSYIGTYLHAGQHTHPSIPIYKVQGFTPRQPLSPWILPPLSGKDACRDFHKESMASQSETSVDIWGTLHGLHATRPLCKTNLATRLTPPSCPLQVPKARLFLLRATGARTLLGPPGLTTRSKKLLGAKGIATRSKDTTRGSYRRAYLSVPLSATPPTPTSCSITRTLRGTSTAEVA